MTAAKDPYVRVFYRIIDDPKFATVYDDDTRLATWLRLLLTADATYPAPAPLPHGINRKALEELVRVGLVDIGTGHRYRMHGMTAVREAAAEQGRKLAAMRYRTAEPQHEPAMRYRTAEPDALNSTQLNSTQTRAMRAHTEELTDREKIADLIHGLTHVYLPSHSKNADRVERWVEKLGWDRVQRELRETAEDLGGLPETNQLLNSTEDRLFPAISAPSAKEAAARAEAEEERKRQARSFDATQRRIRELQTPPQVDPQKAAAALAAAREAITR